MESTMDRLLYVPYFGGTTLRTTWLEFDSRYRSRTFSSPSRVDGLRGPRASCQRYSPWRKAAEARRWSYTHTTCEHKGRARRYTYLPHVFMLWRSNQTINISYLLFLHFSLTNRVNSVPVHAIKVYRGRRRLAPPIPNPVTRGWRLASGPDRFEKGCYGQ